MPIHRALLTALLTAVMIALLTAPALAHQPWFNEDGSPSLSEAWEIEGLNVSQAIYGALRDEGGVDYYRFDAPAGFRAEFSLLVPAVAACDAFRPQLGLMGPGVAAVGDAGSLEVPTGAAVQVASRDEWGEFFEPFSASWSRTGPEIPVDLTAGTYYLAVFDPTGATGNYTLALSGAERGGGDPNWRAKLQRHDQGVDCVPAGQAVPTPAANEPVPALPIWEVVSRWIAGLFW